MITKFDGKIYLKKTNRKKYRQTTKRRYGDINLVLTHQNLANLKAEQFMYFITMMSAQSSSKINIFQT